MKICIYIKKNTLFKLKFEVLIKISINVKIIQLHLLQVMKGAFEKEHSRNS